MRTEDTYNVLLLKNPLGTFNLLSAAGSVRGESVLDSALHYKAADPPQRGALHLKGMKVVDLIGLD